MRPPYDSPLPGRAVLFPTPGGLLRSMERWLPEARHITRKIDGVDKVYDYFDKLPEVLAQNDLPDVLLVDCLSCKLGCNGGPLTPLQDASPDVVEGIIEQREAMLARRHKSSQEAGVPEELQHQIAQHWTPDLYHRTYEDLRKNNRVIPPTDDEQQRIYRRMDKQSEADIFNCASCGYERCERMATAIHNGLNRPENYHHYLMFERQRTEQEATQHLDRLHILLETIPLPVFYKDAERLYTGCNQAFEQFVGRKRNEIIGKTVHTLGSEHVTEQYEKSDAELFENPGSQEYEWVVKTPMNILNNTIAIREAIV